MEKLYGHLLRGNYYRLNNTCNGNHIIKRFMKPLEVNTTCYARYNNRRYFYLPQVIIGLEVGRVTMLMLLYEALSLVVGDKVVGNCLLSLLGYRLIGPQHMGCTELNRICFFSVVSTTHHSNMLGGHNSLSQKNMSSLVEDT
jgi:hypothetical protein